MVQTHDTLEDYDPLELGPDAQRAEIVQKLCSLLACTSPDFIELVMRSGRITEDIIEDPLVKKVVVDRINTIRRDIKSIGKEGELPGTGTGERIVGARRVIEYFSETFKVEVTDE